MSEDTKVIVADLMEPNVKAITADTSIGEAVVSLTDANVHGMPVVEGRSEKLIGVLSTTDVLQAVTECDDGSAREALFQNTLVRDLMTLHPITIGPGADVHDAAQQMLYQDVHRLFVVDRGKLLGVISQSDIVRAVGTARI